MGWGGGGACSLLSHCEPVDSVHSEWSAPSVSPSVSGKLKLYAAGRLALARRWEI